jgi:SAM-dependent methyltransferase
MPINSIYNPKCSPSTLDIFHIRQSIISALSQQLDNFSGTLLDVGCGYMPYKPLLLSPATKVDKYLGLDLENNAIYENYPDLVWNGQKIPLPDCVVDCAIATEVFEHCPDPELIMKEIYRVLKPGGLIFFTVPFLWPLHTVPYDEYRYTPFALERHLNNARFEQIKLSALGGWDASLAQMIGLWAQRRFLAPINFSQKTLLEKVIYKLNKALLKPQQMVISCLVLPIVWLLVQLDKPPTEFYESCMITGLSGTALKRIS